MKAFIYSHPRLLFIVRKLASFLDWYEIRKEKRAKALAELHKDTEFEIFIGLSGVALLLFIYFALLVI